MLLPGRPIAISIAVVFFFGLSWIGWAKGFPLFTCGKRALIGAIVIYVIVSLSIRAINSILISAIITKHINRKEGKDSDSSD